MAWNTRLSQLNDALADLAYSHEAIARLAQEAGLQPSKINFSGNAMEIWHSVISELDKRSKTADLFAVAQEHFAENPFLMAAIGSEHIDYSIAPQLDDISTWKNPDYAELEVLTMEKTTLLPITFLELGMRKAISVAKVEVKIGSSTNVGTGFLAKFPVNDKVFFVTNYHVISDKTKIPYTKIIFNYEDDLEGGIKHTEVFKINAEGIWITSPINEFDVSIFEISDEKLTLKNYGFIELYNVEAPKNEFVNIIQHPGGQSKQLALYHNIITSSSQRAIQYLTDTLKGSSGAPVFNSAWDIVAVHHSGGILKKDEAPLPFGFKSRNEGIRIDAIIGYFDKMITNGK
ncbi:trypsin-like peptidase domain-containing protein [Mucilaginibacter lappiensis]|uniref:Serine protease n=1 Tax=Mucilaginibacter lappiensis TaxID=354630 RepID=A0A841JRW4_9SPHI|nr:trypsin-like peptidase domain-containing protein [Mucilaginibacter lappiensis]MBB6130591.1 V8-like Glu-specific endopeptidase [Mucilaginibacter lappiensis]